MKIYKQQEIFDCGICVTQSLINFFYKKEISREELISNANVSQDGMSILDLEKINQKYGILLDSYELSFEEFIEYKTKDYFILLLDLQSGNHYVIAKKVHDGIVMFDSVAGKKKLSYAQLKPYYANIFIEIKKQTTSLKLINQQLEQKIQIDWVAFSKIFIINIIVLSLTVISGYFIKTIFDSVIASNEISNLGIIIFIAVFGYLTNNFGNFLIEILEANQLQKYYKQLSHELLNRLAHKNNNFFHKISQHQFVMLNYHVEIISKYYSRYFHSFFVNLLNVIVLFIFVLILDWRIISIILTSVVVQMGYTFFAYKFNKKQYPKIKFLIDQSKENYFNLKKFMQDEINNKKLILLLQKIQNNAAHQAAFNYKWSLYNGYFDKVNNFFTSLINLMLYSLGAYLLIRSEIKFSNLIMATTFYGYINNSFAKLVDFYFYTVDFNFSQKIYLNFLSVANNNNQGLAWENIKEIKLENIAFLMMIKSI
ncbi:cysteine peptidase family C39 domain-containing protein [Mycoplasmoides fastidiosum]|uniref:cysteine peptidase family C39 domain-containing protein n=1 Tax=Mycoplasmoides fastidiosum TaxID=92758 RepID=UPI0021152F02|nr:cysteine peptidase family C39 domain-containing protein [Mycoplasmoides fastidiosum]UUD37408.1 cysteine peptidase family C39 domain-containing protein [Mycoplasmoides fastidiosum]